MALFHKLRVAEPVETVKEITEPEKPRFRIRASVVFRLLIAAGFLGAAIYFLHEQLMTTVSIDGVVTSPVISVRAPIEGQVTRVATKPGVEIAGREPVFVIESKAVSDERPVLDLVMRARGLQNQLQQTAFKQRSIADVRDDLQQRRVDYTKATAARLTHMLTESHAQYKGAIASAERARQEAQRAAALVNKGAGTQARVDESVATQKSADAEVERLYSLTRRIEVELASAKSGVIIGEGYGDVPYSQQRIDELNLRLIDLQAERVQIEATLADAKARLDRERKRASQETRREIYAPMHSLIAAVHVAEGTTVSKYAPLLDVIDCQSSFVEASISERTYDAVRIGDSVHVKLYGNAALLEGVVRSVRGSGVRAATNAGAATISASADTMTVAVEISPQALKEATAGTCQVGRVAKVIFGTQPPWREKVDALVASLFPSW